MSQKKDFSIKVGFYHLQWFYKELVLIFSNCLSNLYTDLKLANIDKFIHSFLSLSFMFCFRPRDNIPCKDLPAGYKGCGEVIIR